MKTLPQNLQEELNTKGFVVYHYISFKELMQTVQRDYLRILIKINMVFAVVSGFIGLFALPILFYFLGISYGIIFCILLAKFALRVRDYFHISNVVFTDTGIVIGENLLLYTETQKRKKLLEYYEDEFNEFLTQESKLSEVVKTKRSELFDSVKGLFSKFFAMSKNLGDKNSGKIVTLVTLALGIYSIFLFVFYFLGIFLGFILFLLVGLLVRIVMFFSQKSEILIKIATEKLEREIQVLLKTEKKISTKLQEFSGGKISDIDDFVGTNFEKFYSQIPVILQEQKNLEIIIASSKYQEFINFPKFSLYVKDQYNKPVQHLKNLLKKSLAEVQTQKQEISQKISDLSQKNPEKNSEKNTSEFSGPLQNKLIHFENLEKSLEQNLKQLGNFEV